jgi:excisionase family DNA binding protein
MDQIYTPQEVAFRLKIGYRAVLVLINSGKLGAFQVASRYRVSESSVMQYLSSNKVNR